MQLVDNQWKSSSTSWRTVSVVLLAEPLKTGNVVRCLTECIFFLAKEGEFNFLIFLPVCKEDEKSFGECNPSTCLQKVTTTHYKQMGGMCETLPPVTRMQPCCCRPDEQEVKVRSGCDSNTGLIHEMTTKHVFDEQKRRCLPVTTRRTIRPEGLSFALKPHT